MSDNRDRSNGGAGVVVLDESGSIIRANRTASEIAADEDGFALTRGGLAGATSAETALLRQRIAAAAKTAAGTATAMVGAVLLERPSGRRPYAVLAAPLKDPNALGSDHRGCVVVFTMPAVTDNSTD